MSTNYVADPQTDNIQFALASSTLADQADRWGDTAPTSSVFTVGATGMINGSSDECFAYCFAEVQGFSKMGYYSGTGNARGTKVYCGFKPKWIMIKSTTTGNDWGGNSSVLTGYGLGGQRTRIFVFNADYGQTSATVQFESNGFRPVSTSTGNNQENTIYWYMAFADVPMVGTNGIIALAT